MSLGPTVTLNRRLPWVTARCPCEGEYTAGTSTEGVHLVIHSEPACKPFMDLEPDDFLEAMRLSGAVCLDGGGGGS